jgi:hypothetical protein
VAAPAHGWTPRHNGFYGIHLEFLPGNSQWRVMRWEEHIRLVGFTFVAKAGIHE